MDQAFFVYGPPGSGKTTVGRLLASQLEVPFLDLDAEVEARQGHTITAIMAAQGEAGFRRCERRALEQALRLRPAVVALGGGALLDPESRALVEARGTVICLTANHEALAGRLSYDSTPRPLLEGDGSAKLAALLEARDGHYASFHLRLDTSRLSPLQACWRALSCFGAFRVRGMGRAYDVRLQAGGIDRVGEELRARELAGPVLVVSDQNVGSRYAARVLASLKRADLQALEARLEEGEATKDVRTVAVLWEACQEAGLDRRGVVLALGGGVVGDVAGFAAATYLRGVAWTSVPTSLLAMVDASLGGKTGVNLPQGKNLAGAFHAPALVLADPETLATLPQSEVRNGLAEVVKHAVIDDAGLLDLCREGMSAVEQAWPEVIGRAMAVKVRVIEADPFETGARAVLNLGHTVAHGLELASGFRLRHGEAVAIGIVIEARLAEAAGLAESGLADGLAEVLSGLGLPTEIPKGIDRRMLARAMRADKKRAGQELRFSLPLRVGEVRTGVAIDGWEQRVAGG